MSVTLAREVEQDASDAATINRSIQTLRQKLAKRQQDQHPVILDTDEWGTLHLRPKSFSHNTSPPWIFEQVFTCRRDRETWYVWLSSRDWQWRAAKEYHIICTSPVQVWKEAKPITLTSLDSTEDFHEEH